MTLRDGHARRDWWLLACLALVHILIIGVLFQTVLWMGVSGTRLFWDDVSRMLAGRVPYRDFTLEYPPFSIAVFMVPRLVGRTFLAYYRAYEVMVVACDLAVIAILFALARRDRSAVWPTLVAYTLFVLAIGPIVSQQYDLFPATMVLAAVYALSRRRTVAAGAWLGLGTMTKLFPSLVAPIAIVSMLRRRAYRELARAAAGFSVAIAITFLPLLVIAPRAIRSFFAYHARRGIQIESTYGGLLLAADRLGIARVGVGFSFGSWNLNGPAADGAATASTIVLVLALLTTYWFVDRALGADEIHAYDARILASAALLVVLVTLVSSKVLSPQYLTWALPLVPLVTAALRRTIWALYALIGVLTYYIFPAHYFALIGRREGMVVIVLLIRNALLIVLTGLVATSVWRTTHQVVRPRGEVPA